MNAADSTVSKKPSKAVMKAIFLVIFIVTAIILVRFTPVKNYLTAEALGQFLDSA